jgi:hypothetical protein
MNECTKANTTEQSNTGANSRQIKAKKSLSQDDKAHEMATRMMGC